MSKNFLKILHLKHSICIKYLFLLSALLCTNISIADIQKNPHPLSMGIGGYFMSYSGDFPFTVEGQSGVIPLSNDTNYGLNVEYSKVIGTDFSLDSSFYFSPGSETIKNSTCRNGETMVLISCKVLLENNFYSISVFGTYRYPIGTSTKIYIGSGIAANSLKQKILYKATGYEDKKISSESSSLNMNLGFKLGVSFKIFSVEYVYLGDTKKAKTSALGVSAILITAAF